MTGGKLGSRSIDLLLNKQNPVDIPRSSTDFAGQNIVLEQISHWLSAAEDGYLGENQLLGRLATYFMDRGIQAGAGDLLSHFIRVGILDRMGDEVSFRYRSFQSYFLARYAARSKDFAPRLLEGVGILKYAKEFELLCDLSRKDADLLSYLEVIILELQFSNLLCVDKSTFLKNELSGSFSDIVEDRLENISGGPPSLAKLDEMQDFQDRAQASIAARMTESDGGTEGQDGSGQASQHEGEELTNDVLKLGGYMQAWRVWGRALTSLDYVELSIRKPSFVRLLDYWARLMRRDPERPNAGGVNSSQNFER